MSYYEPDDDGGSFEAAYDAGFWSPDEIDELREIVKLWEFPDPFPQVGNRNDAIFILLDYKLRAEPVTHGPDGKPLPKDPHIIWAETLLGVST